MKKAKILLFISWMIAIFSLAFITFYNQYEVDKFIGITVAKEHKINFSYPVELKKSYILSGGEVKKGELIAELIRSDLSAKIEILNHEIDIAKSNKKAKYDEIETKLKSLNSEYELEVSKVNFQIEDVEFELNRTKELLKSIIKVEDNSFNKFKLKIEALKNQRELQKNSFNIQKAHLNEQLKYESEPFIAKIKALQEEKALLCEKEKKLKVYSPVDGRIGVLNYSENTQIKPFDTIMSIHSKYPEFVVGFIHESLMSNLKIGEELLIKCSNEVNCNSETIYGTIENIDTKLEEIPMELKKYKGIALRGYRVLIKLSKNDFKLGKRVIIYKLKPKSSYEMVVSKLLEFLNLK